MSDDRVDELLVHWELSRQQGRELAAAQLCVEDPQLVDAVAQRIAILQQTSWMLEDPASETFDQTVLDPSTAFPAGTASSPASAAPSDVEFDFETSKAAGPETSSDGDRPTHRSSTPPLPTAIPGFRMVAELGRGGFGAVYRCVDEQLNRTVAVKIPLLHGVRTREEYIREARNAAGLDIAGIVPVYQVGLTSEQVPFVVQKFIEGQSLAAILESGGKLSATQTIQLVVDICRAVGLAHAQSLVHRDLKPANIIIDLEGKPWVTDFGLSVTEDEQVDRRGEVAGTPSYMAPEQLRGRVDWIDGRTDLWAIGIILYECLTGKLPFKARDLSGLCDQILNREPRPICQRAPHLKREWDTIFQKCCAKSVKERYDSTFDLASQLLKLGESLSDSSLQPPNPVLQSLQKTESESPLSVSSRRSLALPHPQARTPAAGRARAFGIAAYLLVVAGGLGAGAMLWNRGKLLEPRQAENPAAVSEPGQVEERTSGRDAIAGNELHVVADADGSIATLQAAIDAAHEGQTITLGPGVYRGSLEITKSIAIHAAERQAKSKPQLIGLGGAAITLRSEARLELRDLQLATELAADKSANTLDVHAGQLQLVNCDVASETFNCVHLRAGASLTAEVCNFNSSQQAAIYAKLAAKLDVRKCQFELVSASEDSASTLVGLQANQCGGFISECTFRGPSATAIEWSESSEPVTISDCQFDTLNRGVAAFVCSSLHVVGRLERSQFTSCELAIELQGCGGKVENCEIDGQQVAGAVGLKISGRSPANQDAEAFRVELCELAGLDTGLKASQTAIHGLNVTLRDSSNMGVVLINNSVLQLDDSQIRNCGNIGMLLESSSAAVLRCEFADHVGAGIVVDGLQDALTATGAMIWRNAVGVLLMSGDIQMVGGEIMENDTGILVARKHKLNHNRTSDAPLHVSADRLSVEANKRAFEFWSPGSYRLNACRIRDPAGESVHLAEGLVESTEGDTIYIQAAN